MCFKFTNSSCNLSFKWCNFFWMVNFLVPLFSPTLWKISLPSSQEKKLWKIDFDSFFDTCFHSFDTLFWAVCLTAFNEQNLLSMKKVFCWCSLILFVWWLHCNNVQYCFFAGGGDGLFIKTEDRKKRWCLRPLRKQMSTNEKANKIIQKQ